MGDFKPRNRGGFGGNRFSGGNRGFGNRSFGNRSSGGDRFGGGDRGRSFGRRDREGPSERFDVICSKCKKPCQVPFKPSNNKPVYCDSCFKNNDSRAPASNGMSSEQLIQINKKLDKILSILEELEMTEELDEDDSEDEDMEDEDDEDEEDSEQSSEESDK